MIQAAYNIGGHNISVGDIQSTILGCRLPHPGQVYFSSNRSVFKLLFCLRVPMKIQKTLMFSMMNNSRQIISRYAGLVFSHLHFHHFSKIIHSCKLWPHFLFTLLRWFLIFLLNRNHNTICITKMYVKN